MTADDSAGITTMSEVIDALTGLLVVAAANVITAVALLLRALQGGRGGRPGRRDDEPQP